MLNSFKYFPLYILEQMFQKVRQENLSKFIKIFQLYQVFMHNFLSQNGKIFIKIFELYQGFVWKSVSLKIGSISFFFFFHLLACKSSTIFQGLTLLVLIFHLSFFECFTFLKFIMQSQKYDNFL